MLTPCTSETTTTRRAPRALDARCACAAASSSPTQATIASVQTPWLTCLARLPRTGRPCRRASILRRRQMLLKKNESATRPQRSTIRHHQSQCHRPAQIHPWLRRHRISHLNPCTRPSWLPHESQSMPRWLALAPMASEAPSLRWLSSALTRRSATRPL